MNLMQKDKKIKLSQVAEFLGAKIELKGNPDCFITGIDPIDDARDGSLSFVNNPKYLKCIDATAASAVIVNEKDVEQLRDCGKSLIISKDAYRDFQKIHLFFYEAKQ